MNYSLVLYPDPKKKKKKNTPTLIHVQTLNTKKVGKKKSSPTYQVCVWDKLKISAYLQFQFIFVTIHGLYYTF